MSKNYTHLAVIGDRSGSMFGIIKDAIGGFNSFLKDQQEADGRATMTMALFDHEYTLIHDMVNVKDVEPMTEETWSPRGATALLDAVGKTISDVSDKISDMKKKKRPERVLVAIITDGQENSSKEFNKETVANLIESKEKEDWQFLFIAADMAAISDAGSWGIKDNNAVFYNNTSEGNKSMYVSLSSVTSHYRSTGKLDVDRF